LDDDGVLLSELFSLVCSLQKTALVWLSPFHPKKYLEPLLHTSTKDDLCTIKRTCKNLKLHIHLYLKQKRAKNRGEKGIDIFDMSMTTAKFLGQIC